MHRIKKTYNGLGGATTREKKKFHYSTLGYEDGKLCGRLSGCIESHEVMDTNNVPFLLSLAAQSKVELCKDPANGVCWLGDQGQVEMRRDHKYY